MSTYTFVDLFCGIGGFRIGFEKNNGTCVFSSEIDAHARKMYELNYNEKPFQDIKKIKSSQIPDHDTLLAGFPCQPFSLSGKRLGFLDVRGTLFFEIKRILKEKKPKAFVLENVKNLKNHDNGKTLDIILKNLNSIGYTTNWKVLNASDFGVPQNRERTIIIGSRNGVKFDFSKLKNKKKVSIKDILEEDSCKMSFLKKDEYTLIKNPKKQKTGLIFVGYLNKKIRRFCEGKKHLSRSHKQQNRIYSSSGCHPTLLSQEGSGRYFILLPDGRVRKLTMIECYRLMGFDDSFKFVGEKINLYNRVGNSIVVPMVNEIAKEVNNQILTLCV